MQKFSRRELMLWLGATAYKKYAVAVERYREIFVGLQQITIWTTVVEKSKEVAVF